MQLSLRLALPIGALIVGSASLAACGDSTVDADPDYPKKVREFDEFPILWLGETFDVDPVSTTEDLSSADLDVSPPLVDPNTGEAILEELRSYSVSYGTCVPPPGSHQSCRVPLTMVFYAPCGTPNLAPALKKETKIVRGVDAIVEIDGKLRIETAEFTVIISPPGADPDDVTANAVQIAENLYGANEKAKHITKDSDFKVKPKDLCTDKPKKDDATPLASATPSVPSAPPVESPVTAPGATVTVTPAP